MDLTQIITGEKFHDSIFKLLASEQRSMAGDSANSHSINTISEMHALMYAEQAARYVTAGVQFQTPTEAAFHIKMRVDKLIAGDEFFNPRTGIGTLLDPNQFTTATVPVMFGPTESSGIYASGGLPSVIIDKKTKGMVAGGAAFKTFDEEFWDTDKLKMLEEAAEMTGANEALSTIIRDANIFGGAITHPVFKNDSISTFSRPLDKLHLEKDCIERWVCADRWNVVYVPSYNITAEDYLSPRTIYLPLGGYAVSTTRCSLLRPKMLPYWALLYNIGWVPSDFTGWIRSYYGYNMLMQAIPIMAQQMSLLLYQIPLDALMSSVGFEGAKKMMELNEEKMAEWSMLHPKAVNMIGEVQTVNRTFSGFEQFVGALKSDLASTSGIPEPVLFHTPNKGFSDNTQEALLKESETMKMQQRSVEPQLIYITDALIAHVFGTDSEEWAQRRRVTLTFDKPLVSTEKDMAEIGARYAATVASLAQAEVPPVEAIKLAGQFFKNIEVTQEQLDAIQSAWDDAKALEEKEVEAGIQAQKQRAAGGGQGHSAASTGLNTGHFTKPVKGKK